MYVCIMYVSKYVCTHVWVSTYVSTGKRWFWYYYLEWQTHLWCGSLVVITIFHNWYNLYLCNSKLTNYYSINYNQVHYVQLQQRVQNKRIMKKSTDKRETIDTTYIVHNIIHHYIHTYTYGMRSRMTT